MSLGYLLLTFDRTRSHSPRLGKAERYVTSYKDFYHPCLGQLYSSGTNYCKKNQMT